MEGDSTETLRALAPKWTLAGDDKLLDILQKTHQSIITKCQEVNTKLSDMSSALDDASISLQNVNNKFMALSNSQFIESRVYDDDDVTTVDVPTKEAPPPKVESELSMLKRSIAVLESMHESVTILRDSDTETDSEDEEIARTVLKPKDMYASRPLPHIIGSQLWKSKWHAGLLPEDSDSDSSTSKRESRDLDEYSESDQEIESNLQTDTLKVPDRTVSETSSDLMSEQDVLPQAPKQTPSDIAAELARRLGGQPPKVIESEPDVTPSKPPTRKVYRPDQPVTGRVFSDEPPPIDDYVSESSSDDGDIFAELHKKPHEIKKNVDVNPVEDLFGFGRDDGYQGGDIFGDSANDKVTSNQSTTQKLFANESDSSLFIDKKEKELGTEGRKENESGSSGVKKPVGGISVFGNNKGAESIGAAILRRQRKSSSSSEANSDTFDEGASSTKNDVFDDLFDKSKRSEKGKTVDKSKLDAKVSKSVIDELFERNKQKGAVKKVEMTTKSNVLSDLFEKSSTIANISKKRVTDKTDYKTAEKPKIDLFNDDLFDDIDDIFTTNVVKIPKKEDKNQKSLFDDEDDLFAEIATGRNKENVKSNVKIDKGILESDDDLFTDRPQTIRPNKVTDSETKPHIDEETKEIGSIASESKKIDRSIFDSDDELFSEKPVVSNTSKIVVGQKSDNKIEDIAPSISNEISISNDNDIFYSEDELFKNMPSPLTDSKHQQNTDMSKSKVTKTKEVISDTKNIIANKSIFDSDDELFTSKPGALKVKSSKESAISSVLVQEETKTSGLNINKKNDNTNILNTKKSIFDSDSDSDIFSNDKVTPKIKEEVSKGLNKTNQKRESYENSNLQTLVVNTTDKLSNLRSPSLFDDDDEMFVTKDAIKNPVIDKEVTNSHIINQPLKSDVVQSYKENTEVIDDVDNRDNENTQFKLDVKIYNDNKEKTLSKIDDEDLDKLASLAEYNLNINETYKSLDSTKENSTLRSEATKNPANITSNNVEVTDKINKKDIRDSHSKYADNSIFNVNKYEKTSDLKNDSNGEKINSQFIEKTQLSDVHDLPVGTDSNDIKVNESSSKKTPQTLINEILESKQTSNILEPKEKPVANNTKPNIFKDIFNEAPDFSETIDSQSTETLKKTDVFSDIFSEPPVFEKPKEPKKSKNVNALFDDDSDDEALFFKKSDIVDDVPNDLSPDNKKDNLFGIFHDEPPAIDVDFVTNSKDNVIINVEGKENVSQTYKDPINNNQFELKLDNKEINKADKNKSALEIPQELKVNEDSKDTKTELDIPTDNNIFNPADKKSINIHDLFSKNDDIFKSDFTSSKNTLKNVESFGESTEILNENKPDNEVLNKIPANKQGKRSSIFDDLSDDDIFKPSNIDNKKKVVVQEDEIDNLFIAKNKKSSFETSKSFDDIFKTTQHEILIKETKIIHGSPDDNSYNELEDKNKKEHTITPNLKDEVNDSSENSFKSEEVDVIRNLDSIKAKPDSETAGQKKIGKLKAKINIDVSKLLPGASPKKKIEKPKSPEHENISPTSIIPTPFVNKDISKPKIHDETIKQEIKDVTNESNKDSLIPPNNNEDKLENSDQKTSKTITFDEKSSILDNTLSKERAKIQVKRRPSTRRARREAVRKSIIDNDSTDNSSSIDDQPKSLDIDLPSSYDKQEPLPTDTTNKDIEILKTEKQTSLAKEDNTITHKNVQDNKESVLITDNGNVHRETEISNKNITSKIVYVLNDEDIFNTKPHKNLEKNKIETTVTENINPISTLGNVYKDNSNITNVAKNENKKSKAPLFSESSDEDKLFGKGKNRKTFKTKVLFDSDSDDDLFVGSKDKKETKDDFRKRVPTVKGSLFGDDDDDDLFGDKRKKSDTTIPSRPGTSREVNTSSEPVFQDPLSMFGDDD